MVVPWQPLYTGFTAAALHQVSLMTRLLFLGLEQCLVYYLYRLGSNILFNYSCLSSSIRLNITRRMLKLSRLFPPHILSTALPTQCRFISTPTWLTTTCTIYSMGMLILFARFGNKYVTNYLCVGIVIYIAVITVMSGSVNDVMVQAVTL